MGYASVSGYSTATFFGNTTSNSYTATSAHYFGSSLAAGGSIPAAGGAIGVGNFTGFVVVGAAGGAVAYAK